MKYDTYIFDLDGTLLNTIDDLAFSCNYALASFDMPTFSVDVIRKFVGNGVKKLIERAVPQGLDNPLFNQVYEEFRLHYLANGIEHTYIYESIPTLIDMLQKAGKHIAVVTNKFDPAAKKIMHHFFGNQISVVVGESKDIPKKPSANMVYKALSILGVSEENAVYIGDSDVDITTARNCRIPCISVLWGFRDLSFLLAHGASVLVNTPLDIARI